MSFESNSVESPTLKLELVTKTDESTHGIFTSKLFYVLRSVWLGEGAFGTVYSATGFFLNGESREPAVLALKMFKVDDQPYYSPLESAEMSAPLYLNAYIGLKKRGLPVLSELHLIKAGDRNIGLAMTDLTQDGDQIISVNELLISVGKLNDQTRTKDIGKWALIKSIVHDSEMLRKIAALLQDLAVLGAQKGVLLHEDCYFLVCNPNGDVRVIIGDLDNVVLLPENTKYVAQAQVDNVRAANNLISSFIQVRESIESSVLRREQKLRAFEDTAVMRLVEALPAIEQLVFDRPGITKREFEEACGQLAAQNKLNEIQLQLILDGFDKFVADRAHIQTYLSLVDSTFQEGESGGMPAFGKNDVKRKLLADLGATNLNDQLLDKFEIEQSIPSCLVIHFHGTPLQLDEVLADTGDAGGFFIKRLEANDEEIAADPLIQQRVDLLSGRVIIVANPPPGADKMYLIDPPRTRIHEIRHYLFLLYLGEQTNNTSNAAYVDASVRDELQARIFSGWWTHNLSDVLQGNLPTAASEEANSKIYLRDFPELTSQLVELFFEIERLHNSGIPKVNWTVGGVLLTAPDIETAIRRLKKVGAVPVNQYDILRALVYVTDDLKPTSPDRKRENNLTYFEHLINRCLAAQPTNSELGEFVDTLAYQLDDWAYWATGQDGERYVAATTQAIADIESLQRLFVEAGYTEATRPLNQPIMKIRADISKRKQQEQEVRAWSEFLEYLSQSHPELRAEYDALQAKRTVKAKLDRHQFREDKLNSLFEDWRRNQTNLT